MNKQQAYEQNQLAMRLANEGRTDEAIDAFKEAVRLDPSSKAFLGNVGLTYRKADRAEEAIDFYQKFLRDHPDNITALEELGLAHHGAGSHQEACEVYKQVLALDPNNTRILRGLGTASLIVGEYEDGIEAYKHLISLEPENYKAYDGLGLAYIVLGQAEGGNYKSNEMIEALETAVRLMPDYPDSRFNLGHAYTLVGNLIKAHEHADVLEELDEEQYDELINIINLHEDQEASSLDDATSDLDAINTLSDRFVDAIERESRSANFGNKILLMTDDDLVEEGEKVLRLYEAEQNRHPEDINIKTSLANHLFRLGHLYHESLYPRALQLQMKPVSADMFSSPEIAHRCCVYMHRSYQLLPQPQSAVILADVFQMVGFHATALHWLDKLEQAAIAFDDVDLQRAAKADTMDLKAEGLTLDPPLGKPTDFPRRDTPGLLIEKQSAKPTPKLQVVVPATKPSPRFVLEASPTPKPQPPKPVPSPSASPDHPNPTTQLPASAGPAKSGGCAGVLVMIGAVMVFLATSSWLHSIFK